MLARNSRRRCAWKSAEASSPKRSITISPPWRELFNPLDQQDRFVGVEKYLFTRINWTPVNSSVIVAVRNQVSLVGIVKVGSTCLRSDRDAPRFNRALDYGKWWIVDRIYVDPPKALGSRWELRSPFRAILLSSLCRNGYRISSSSAEKSATEL